MKLSTQELVAAFALSGGKITHIKAGERVTTERDMKYIVRGLAVPVEVPVERTFSHTEGFVRAGHGGR